MVALERRSSPPAWRTRPRTSSGCRCGRPRRYREIEIDSGRSPYDLAEAIVPAFDLDLDHAFGFYGELTGNYTASPVRYELFADMEGGSSDALSVKRTKAARASPAAGGHDHAALVRLWR